MLTDTTMMRTDKTAMSTDTTIMHTDTTQRQSAVSATNCVPVTSDGSDTCKVAAKPAVRIRKAARIIDDSDSSDRDQRQHKLKRSPRHSPLKSSTDNAALIKDRINDIAMSSSDDTLDKLQPRKKLKAPSKKARLEIEKETQRLLRGALREVPLKPSFFNVNQFLDKMGVEREKPFSAGFAAYEGSKNESDYDPNTKEAIDKEPADLVQLETSEAETSAIISTLQNSNEIFVDSIVDSVAQSSSTLNIIPLVKGNDNTLAEYSSDDLEIIEATVIKKTLPIPVRNRRDMMNSLIKRAEQQALDEREKRDKIIVERRIEYKLIALQKQREYDAKKAAAEERRASRQLAHSQKEAASLITVSAPAKEVLESLSLENFKDSDNKILRLQTPEQGVLVNLPGVSPSHYLNIPTSQPSQLSEPKGSPAHYLTIDNNETLSTMKQGLYLNAMNEEFNLDDELEGLLTGKATSIEPLEFDNDSDHDEPTAIFGLETDKFISAREFDDTQKTSSEDEIEDPLRNLRGDHIATPIAIRVSKGRILDSDDEEYVALEAAEKMSPVWPLLPQPRPVIKSVYIEQEAEEEDDEFKGLGGADGENPDDDDSDMNDPLIVMDDAAVGGNAKGEENVLKLRQKQMNDLDQQAIDALLNDVTSGALRKKGFGVAARANRDGKGFELEDSDDDEDMIRRIKLRYAKDNRRADADADGSISERYANNPETASFADSMQMHVDDMSTYISAQEEEIYQGPLDDGDRLEEQMKFKRFVDPHELDNKLPFEKEDDLEKPIEATGARKRRIVLSVKNHIPVMKPSDDDDNPSIRLAVEMGSKSMSSLLNPSSKHVKIRK